MGSKKKIIKENKNQETQETQSMESWLSAVVLQIWEIKTYQHPLFISSTKFLVSSLTSPIFVPHIHSYSYVFCLNLSEISRLITK